MIPDFLAEQRDETPEELQGLILKFENFWERKLWHQLTEALLQFFRDPRSEPQRLAFYKVFVLKFADKINQLKLVELALAASTQCPSTAPFSSCPKRTWSCTVSTKQLTFNLQTSEKSFTS